MQFHSAQSHPQRDCEVAVSAQHERQLPPQILAASTVHVADDPCAGSAISWPPSFWPVVLRPPSSSSPTSGNGTHYRWPQRRQLDVLKSYSNRTDKITYRLPSHTEKDPAEYTETVQDAISEAYHHNWNLHSKLVRGDKKDKDAVKLLPRGAANLSDRSHTPRM